MNSLLKAPSCRGLPSKSRPASPGTGSGLPPKHGLELEHHGVVVVAIEGRVGDELEVGLEPERRRELHGIEGFRDVFVLMVNGFARGRGLAPDKADAEQVVAGPLQEHVLERSLHHKPRADLGRRVAGDLLAAEAEAAKPAKGRTRAELLLEVEAKAAAGGPSRLGQEWMDAVNARAQAQHIIGRVAEFPQEGPGVQVEVRSRARRRQCCCLPRRPPWRTTLSKAATGGSGRSCN